MIIQNLLVYLLFIRFHDTRSNIYEVVYEVDVFYTIRQAVTANLNSPDCFCPNQQKVEMFGLQSQLHQARAFRMSNRMIYNVLSDFEHTPIKLLYIPSFIDRYIFVKLIGDKQDFPPFCMKRAMQIMNIISAKVINGYLYLFILSAISIIF